ncbi:hypothetical protein Hdeb2414_s0017g00504621 [Helianthus debilis subsp. tardiflorus]
MFSHLRSQFIKRVMFYATCDDNCDNRLSLVSHNYIVFSRRGTHFAIKGFDDMICV